MSTPNLAASWEVAAASVAGASHVVSGRGADDAFAYSIFEGGSLVAAVADGAGSRSGTSAFGSFAACQAVMNNAPKLLDELDSGDSPQASMSNVFQAALEAIEARSIELGLAPRQLATTLAVAVITPSATTVAQVGDGIVACEINGHPQVLVPEVKGEYANETVFLTSPGALDSHLQVEHLALPVKRFALSTDGLRYKILKLQEGGLPFEPFFEAIWKLVESGGLKSEKLSEWLNELDDQTGDDKTLIVGGRADSLGNGRVSLRQAISAEPLPPTALAPSQGQSLPSGLKPVGTGPADKDDA